MVDVTERFWSKVDKSGDCWEWTAHKNDRGYGMFSIKGKPVRAHRYSWELAHGLIPKGKHYGTMCACHCCDNPGCVNPDHIFISDQAGNIADKVAKGRHKTPVGTKNGGSKLRDNDIRVIRKMLLSGISRAEIGRLFEVTYNAIWRIDIGRTWKHISEGET